MKLSVTTYVSARAWAEIPSEIRKAILREIGYKKSEVVNNGWFIANLQNALTIRGVYGLANALTASDPWAHFEHYLQKEK